jgi:hypothetical protein
VPPAVGKAAPCPPRNSSGASCSTFYPKAIRRSATTASLAPASVTGSNRSANHSVQSSRRSQPIWLKSKPPTPHPQTRL